MSSGKFDDLLMACCYYCWLVGWHGALPDGPGKATTLSTSQLAGRGSVARGVWSWHLGLGTFGVAWRFVGAIKAYVTSTALLAAIARGVNC